MLLYRILTCSRLLFRTPAAMVCCLDTIVLSSLLYIILKGVYLLFPLFLLVFFLHTFLFQHAKCGSVFLVSSLTADAYFIIINTDTIIEVSHIVKDNLTDFAFFILFLHFVLLCWRCENKRFWWNYSA